MIYGVGVDIIEIERVRGVLKRKGERFLKRVYTNRERELCRKKIDPSQELSAYFCAKEAFLKALGTGKSERIRWKDVSVDKDPKGKPLLRISGIAREKLVERNISNIQLSLSHSDFYAVAVVILEN